MPNRKNHPMALQRARRISEEMNFDPWSKVSAECGAHYHHDSLGAVDLKTERQTVLNKQAQPAAAAKAMVKPTPRSEASTTSPNTRIDRARMERATEYAREQRVYRQAGQKDVEPKPPAQPRARLMAAANPAIKPQHGRRQAQQKPPQQSPLPPQQQQQKQQLALLEQQVQQKQQLALLEQQVRHEQLQDQLEMRVAAQERGAARQRSVQWQEPAPTSELSSGLQERVAQQRKALGLHPDAAMGERAMRQREAEHMNAQEETRRAVQQERNSRAPGWWPREQPRGNHPGQLRALLPPGGAAPAAAAAVAASRWKPPSPATQTRADARLHAIWKRMSDAEVSQELVEEATAILELKKMWAQLAEAQHAEKAAAAQKRIADALQPGYRRPFRSDGLEAAALVHNGLGL